MEQGMGLIAWIVLGLVAGLIAKAERGELALTLPVGLMRDPSGVVVKDPDLAVQERLGLVFRTFLRFRTVAKLSAKDGRLLVGRGVDVQVRLPNARVEPEHARADLLPADDAVTLDLLRRDLLDFCMDRCFSARVA